MSSPKPILVTQNPQVLNIYKVIERVASYKTTCLILGESGTGKELVARMIHDQSPRKDHAFIAINCSAIPENLLESELFGYEKGAFTGASKIKKGIFEEAFGGTLFLDEIGEMPILLQTKILRVLQEEEIRRVGDTNSIKTDVRIIAATLKDLAHEVKEGRFREDLFYRLNVLPIHLLPLRDRSDDIPLLTQHFIQSLNEKLQTDIKGVDPEVMERWKNYLWPGNIRELENTIERSMVMARSGNISLKDLPHDFLAKPIEAVSAPKTTNQTEEDLSIKKRVRAMEQDLILKALQKTKGNRTHAARILEISHRALLYKLKEYGLLAKILKK